MYFLDVFFFSVAREKPREGGQVRPGKDHQSKDGRGGGDQVLRSAEVSKDVRQRSGAAQEGRCLKITVFGVLYWPCDGR